MSVPALSSISSSSSTPKDEGWTERLDREAREGIERYRQRGEKPPQHLLNHLKKNDEENKISDESVGFTDEDEWEFEESLQVGCLFEAARLTPMYTQSVLEKRNVI
jgi:hypothetical protein